MRLNRTGRKFAVFYVAVTLTVFVCQELTRVPITLVHDLAFVVGMKVGFLPVTLDYWPFKLLCLLGQIQGLGALTRVLDSEYVFLALISIGAPLYFCLGWMCEEIVELARRRSFPDPPAPRGDDPPGWQPRCFPLMALQRQLSSCVRTGFLAGGRRDGNEAEVNFAGWQFRGRSSAAFGGCTSPVPVMRIDCVAELAE